MIHNMNINLKKYCSLLLLTTMYSLQAQNTGINTNSPTKTLDVNGELRVRTLSQGNASHQIIVSDQNGNIFKKPISAALPVIGDIKDGYATADHDGWYLLNGRALSSLSTTVQGNALSLGFTVNLPDFTGKYPKALATGENMNTISGSASYTLTKANMPNFSMTAVAQTAGDHYHSTIDAAFGQISPGFGYGLWGYSGSTGTHYYSRETSNPGNHTHTVTLASNGSGQAIGLSPAYIALNTFVYLGN